MPPAIAEDRNKAGCSAPPAGATNASTLSDQSNGPAGVLAGDEALFFRSPYTRTPLLMAVNDIQRTSSIERDGIRRHRVAGQ
jgi:hypothetical protein